MLCPTSFLRYERRDAEAFNHLVLQQWWTDEYRAANFMGPEDSTKGEWRDVPIVPAESPAMHKIPAILRKPTP